MSKRSVRHQPGEAAVEEDAAPGETSGACGAPAAMRNEHVFLIFSQDTPLNLAFEGMIVGRIQ